MAKETIPSIHFYDQDFVDLYDRSWVWIGDLWKTGTKENGISGNFVSYEGQKTVSLFESCISSLFLNYSNQVYSPCKMIDYFYSRQEPNGAIRDQYSLEDGSAVVTEDNPLGISLPLLAYVEFNFYHKIGDKKRLKEAVPFLEKYFEWINKTFLKENGLYSVPTSACQTFGIPRDNVCYPVDFNSMVALNAFYMSEIGDILNDKELAFKYKRMYFAIKTRLNNLMWDPETGFYYDLDANETRTDLKLIGAFWTLLAEIPNDEKAARMVSLLKDPAVFGSDNPFPNVSMDSSCFREDAKGLCGAVLPINVYAVVKGLEKYGEFIFARECAIRHLYYILDTFQPDDDRVGEIWEAYLPCREGYPAQDSNGLPRKRYLPQVGLVTITLMIENIIGLNISLPRKTVNWTVPSLEMMGIENLSLKRNYITIFANKNNRCWEIRLESEKLYYFTIELLNDNKKKTWPMPSGKCSLLIDKL